MTKRTKLSEFKHFNKLANEWWSESGKFKILHKIKPIRIKYIMNHISSKNIKNLEILDIGCGGGLVCEPLAKLGFAVTGIDFVENNIKVAKLHALKNNLKIKYYTQDIDDLSFKKKYDLIILFEVLEHVPSPVKTISNLMEQMNSNAIFLENFIKHVHDPDEPDGCDLESAAEERDQYYEILNSNFDLVAGPAEPQAPNETRM